MPTLDETLTQMNKYCEQIIQCQNETEFFIAYEKINQLYSQSQLGEGWGVRGFLERWEKLKEIYESGNVLVMNHADSVYSQFILKPDGIFLYSFLMACMDKQCHSDDDIREIYSLFENMTYTHLYRAIAGVESNLELLRAFSKSVNYAAEVGYSPINFDEVITEIDNLESDYKWSLLHLMNTFIEYENSLEESNFYPDTIVRMVELKAYLEKTLGIGLEEESNRASENKVINSEDQESIPATEADILARLDDIIGLEEVKNFIRELYSHLVIIKKRKELGLATIDTQTLHMIFKGNPGTGKTTFARIVSQLLQMVGYLRAVKLTETDRSGLVAGYVGQTAEKTKQVVTEALDGVLFIDEAYSLGNDANSQGGFGKEAIDTLVKLMDDNRERLVIILAGYSKDMDDFLNINPGLKSRFPNIIEFPDYSTEELLLIAKKMYQEADYILTDESLEKMKEVFELARQDSQFGNGRYVRNVFEKSLRIQSRRLYKESDLTKDKLMTIDAPDIEKI